MYDFVGCATIEGLSFLDIIHNIDCYVVFDGQTTVLELRKTEDDRTRWMTACIYPVVSSGWTTTVELRETTNWICLVVFGGHTVTRRCRKTGDNLTLDDWLLGASASCVWRPGDNLWFSSNGRRQLMTTNLSLLLFIAQDGGEG